MGVIEKANIVLAPYCETFSDVWNMYAKEPGVRYFDGESCMIGNWCYIDGSLQEEEIKEKIYSIYDRENWLPAEKANCFYIYLMVGIPRLFIEYAIMRENIQNAIALRGNKIYIYNKRHFKSILRYA